MTLGSDDSTIARSVMYLCEAIRRQAVGDGTWVDLVAIAERISRSVDNGALEKSGWNVAADFVERRPPEERADLRREQGGPS